MSIDWSDLWNDTLIRILPDGAAAPRVLWVALALVAVVVAWPAARRTSRTLVTIVHEAGHAGVGVLVGRRFQGFVVEKDLSGHAVTAGRSRGPGRIATTWAGYPAPAVLGALVVVAALGGLAGPVLVVSLIALVVLLVMSRSVRTVALVVLTIAVTGAVWWFGGQWRAGVVGGVGLALLLGAWDSLGDVARSRGPGQDHRTLAELTPLPAGFWLFTWFLTDVAATALALLAVREAWQAG